MTGNDVSGNHPTEDTPLAGGILVVSSASLSGSDPAGDTIRSNHLHGNAPADLVYDGSGKGNTFAKNVCGASAPDGLCG